MRHCASILAELSSTMTCASWSGPNRCLTLIRPLFAIGPMGSIHPSLFSPPTMINIIISVSFLYFQHLWECLFFSANVPAVKAWLLYSNSAGSQQVTCRNKNENMRTFGNAETDFSSCVEFCELHVDSSGHLWLQLVVSFVKRKSLFQNCSAEVFSQDSQSCVPTPASTTTATTSSSWTKRSATALTTLVSSPTRTATCLGLPPSMGWGCQPATKDLLPVISRVVKGTTSTWATAWAEILSVPMSRNATSTTLMVTTTEQSGTSAGYMLKKATPTISTLVRLV